MKLPDILSSIIMMSGVFGMSLGTTAQAAPHDAPTSRTSQAQVHIDNGTLSLDAVPDFSFTNAGSANEYRLHLAHPGKDNRVQVTDYRNLDRPGSHHPRGWHLNVSSPQISAGTDLQLNDRDTTSPGLTHPVTLDEQRPAQDFMGNYHGNGYGTHTTYFDKSRDADLLIPNSAAASHHIDIDWQLSTPIDSDVNRG